MDKIEVIGKILFEPENVTNKHNAQASWKRIAMIMVEGDVAEYYAWFVKKRYNLTLNKPIRGSHISFINDSHRDLGEYGLKMWETVKKKWDGETIKILLSVDARTDGKHWWLNIPNEDRDELHAIRAELGLGRPFFGLHLSLGYANERNIEHSEYIHGLIQKGLITT
jgi:hypothetical protein